MPEFEYERIQNFIVKIRNKGVLRYCKIKKHLYIGVYYIVDNT